MPVIKSAIKKLRKDRKREIKNDKFRNDLNAAVKSAKKLKSGAAVTKAFSVVDKAVKKNLLHKNKAARVKSALSKLSKPASKKIEKAVSAVKKKTVKKSSTKKAK